MPLGSVITTFIIYVIHPFLPDNMLGLNRQ